MQSLNSLCMQLIVYESLANGVPYRKPDLTLMSVELRDRDNVDFRGFSLVGNTTYFS